MRFENTGLEDKRVDFKRLLYICEKHGLVHGEQWDYQRVTFDRKFQLKEGTYYLRLFGYAVEGDVGSHRATIQLMTPLLGKHYYPHGVEYGEEESFPASLVETCERILTDIKDEVNEFAV
ncbi:YugN family protein [Bacillus thermotolerans]|uniref:Phenylalanyl-tRNA synthetase alpha subunit n=1 Tax=Bacillus thermotolerans TaxID=1221996 RepID=A0A0F5I124_BACTR|nr:YugN family protein [Bacillus thermotolerans]KKB39226.1 Phenylalanyl-tRNA synthetase alpha subunit [Bacillus thermotolerans]KKB42241.1 Phenylalanyl-tRNA synthetase alpha subunit [Bacillus thermotolerans]